MIIFEVLAYNVENDDFTCYWICDEYVIIVLRHMLLMWIHELGDEKCVVVIKLLCSMILLKMSQEWRSLILVNSS